MSLSRKADAIADVSGKCAMAVAMLLLVYMVLHILLEIVLRTFFATSTYAMDEFVGYAVGTMTFLALADSFRNRAHIRVGLLLSRLPARAAVVVEVICIALTFAITAFIARYLWRMLVRDFERGSVSPTLNEVPVWIVDAALLTGLVLFLVQLIASLLKTLTTGEVLYSEARE